MSATLLRDEYSGVGSEQGQILSTNKGGATIELFKEDGQAANWTKLKVI